MCGCETWSVTLGDESRPRLFENMVMRKVFGPGKEEVIGDCRKQHNEKVHDLCCSEGNILVTNTEDEMGWECGTCGRKINTCRILVGKPEGNLGTKRLRGRPRNRWQEGVGEDGRIVGGEGWQEKVHNREEWKKLLRTARNCRILHMPME